MTTTLERTIERYDPRRGFPEDRFAVIRDVPVFVEHETTIRGRRLRFGPRELAAIAERCNRRIQETGDFVPLTLGHTPLPGENKPDPEVVGFAGPFRVGEHEGKAAILADFHVFREDVERLRKYPRRSPELWLEEPLEESYLDPIALLGAETPKLDMGLLVYRAAGEGRTVERYTAVAPTATNCFLPEQERFEKENVTMPLSPEDIQQIVQALEQLDWVQWTKQKMAAEAAGDAEGAKPYEKEGEPPEPEPNPAPEPEGKNEPPTAPVPNARKDRDAQPERYRQLEAELVRLRRELETERNCRKNAERYSELHHLRQEYQFDLEREMERCRAEKMSDEAFAEHLAVIRENYQRIPVHYTPPLSQLASGPVGEKERYEKTLHDRARAICERKALKGERVDYLEIVEQLRAGKDVA